MYRDQIRSSNSSRQAEVNGMEKNWEHMNKILAQKKKESRLKVKKQAKK